jgi:hypothetical protein
MRSIGLPELLVVFGGLVGFAFYGIIFFILWKFYHMFGKVHDNIAGIKQVLERNGQNR